MSIQSAVGNLVSGVNNDLQSILMAAKTALQNIVGSVNTGLNTMWSGGFAGIDENNLDIMKNALIEYCDTIDAHINEFDQMSKLEVAYKGVIQDAADEFVKSVKDILVAYVSTMRRNISEADNAFQNYKEAAQQIAQNVSTDAEQVRSEAQKIKLD